MPGVHGSATPGYPIEATKGRGYHPHPSRLAGPSSHQPPSSILFLSLPSSSHPAHRIASGHRHPPCSLPPGGTGMFIAARWHRNVHCRQVAPECSLPPGGTGMFIAARWHRNVHCHQVAPECSLPPGGTGMFIAARWHRTERCSMSSRTHCSTKAPRWVL